MKFIQKYLLIWFFAYWFGYLGLSFLFSNTQWKELQMLNFTLLGFVLAVLFIGAICGGLYFSIIPRMRYIESSDLKVPFYNDRQESIITPTKDDFSFAELQSKINQNWILTYVDPELNIIKFRTKDTIFHWGAGGYLAYDNEINAVSVISFPFTGYTQHGKRLKTELNNKVEAMILN